MNIQDNTVATIDFIVTDQKGQVLDTTNGHEPLAVLIGHGCIVSGLEKALIGHEVGDRVDAEVLPNDAYGHRNPGLVQTVDKSLFEGMDLNVGDTFMADTDAGKKPIVVKEIRDNEVVVDGNHPLAGITLRFMVDVIDVRAASESEIKHGHVHGKSGCCCHDEHNDEGGCCGHHHEGDNDHHCCHNHDGETSEHQCHCQHDHENEEHHCCCNEEDEK